MSIPIISIKGRRTIKYLNNLHLKTYKSNTCSPSHILKQIISNLKVGSYFVMPRTLSLFRDILLCFTPKTYNLYRKSRQLPTPSIKGIFKILHKKLVPSTSWEVIEFFTIQKSLLITSNETKYFTYSVRLSNELNVAFLFVFVRLICCKLVRLTGPTKLNCIVE